ncbi:methionine synthase reductase-like isoform X2 [Corticium candelabrum]|uniref:methionine synthase reductase-like isoform X2 n=1 Tax=Corticium candelabrum TaxID=121492 RepID=UPI002E26A51D|nr:methionine synthase reductase-like isoform X2 [Corticium candelabrum]
MSRRFLLLYASQTGQAEAIAKNEIHSLAQDHGLSPVTFCMSQKDKKFEIEKESVVVFIVSTTGDGDPPDTAQKFWRCLKNQSLSKSYLKHLKFALLGLGDSNYTNFCNFSRMLGRRLLELGATSFYETGYADDSVGLERVVEPWTDGLWTPIRKVLGLPKSDKEESKVDDKLKLTRSGLIQAQPVQALDLKGLPTASRSSPSSPKDGNGTSKFDSKKDVPLTGKTADTRDNNLTSSETTNGTKQEKVTNQPVVVVSDISISCNDKTVTDKSTPSDGGSTNDTHNHAVASKQFVSKKHSSKAKPSSKKSGASTTKKPSVIGWKSGGSAKVKDKASASKTAAGHSTHSKTSRKEAAAAKAKDAVLANGAAIKDTNSETFDKLIAALRKNNADLDAVSLTLPVLPHSLLNVQYAKGLLPVLDFTNTKQYAESYPSQATSLFIATITACQQLSRDDAVKTALEVELDTKGSNVTYTPGDSFSIVCENNSAEVEWLVERLGLTAKANVGARLSVREDSKAIDPCVPVHLPNHWTPRGWLKNCCDIRAVPRKMFLRQLAECTSDPQEKNRLLQLCSRQGSAEYASLIREKMMSFIDILDAFPSTMPSLNVVLEGLPRLQPRSYSVTSSPLALEDKVKFVFNVVGLPAKRTEERKGVCTGWLDRLTKRFKQGYNDLDKPSKLPSNPPKIPIFLRVNNRFKIPEDYSVPLIMIGPGTGIAPFVGFLQHRQEQQMAAKAAGMRKVKFGETWLFFGCRHKDRDFLYRKQLEQFVANGTLSHFNVAFSRDEGQHEYAPRMHRYLSAAMRGIWLRML